MPDTDRVPAWRGAVWGAGRAGLRAGTLGPVRGLILTLAVLIAVAVAVGRVYRGMHYLPDVVGGILLGGAWLLATVHGIRLGAAHWQLRHRTASRK